MNKVLILGLIALVGCGGKMVVPGDTDSTAGAGGDADAEGTITIECTETNPDNFVCAIPEDEVLNLVLQGQKGEQGVPGEVGPQGLPGLNGVDGLPGAQGEKGETGDTGPIGPQGLQGPQGVQGFTGATGSQGLKGDKGDKGATGAAGQDGAACLYLTIDQLNYEGQCLFVGDGIWVEHEGGKVDVYNNSSCAHSPSPKKAYCDNLIQDKVCWAGTNRIEVVKYKVPSHHDDEEDKYVWKVYKFNVAPECSQDNSN